MRTLLDLLVVETQDLHAAETQLQEALPRMIEQTRADALRDALLARHAMTPARIAHLERALGLMGAVATDDVCEAMDGIVAQAEELMEDALPGELFDAALLITARKIAHFEIATYAALAALAEAAGREDVARLMRAGLGEETLHETALVEAGARDVNRMAARLDAA
jgi:ferritin-like metal-binding protein YciE